MNNDIFKYYVNEINLLANFVKIAAEHFNKTLNEENDDTELIWYDLQNIITYSADISKILWGSNTSDRVKRQKIRDILEVEDKWEISYNNKTLRNKLEHIDEHIIKFASKNHPIVYDRHIVANYNAIIINGVGLDPNKESTLRSYNLELGEYVIFGRAFNIKKACEECRKLRLKTDELIKNEVTYESMVSDDQ
ncbi:hypothetical protein ACWM0J_01425 [Pediococcus acidilactici]